MKLDVLPRCMEARDWTQSKDMPLCTTGGGKGALEWILGTVEAKKPNVVQLLWHRKFYQVLQMEREKAQEVKLDPPKAKETQLQTGQEA